MNIVLPFIPKERNRIYSHVNIINYHRERNNLESARNFFREVPDQLRHQVMLELKKIEDRENWTQVI